MRSLIPANFALALGALAMPATAARPTSAERMQKELDGLVAGKPVDCINQFPTLRSTTYDGAIIYRDGRRAYLNNFGGNCSLRNGDAIVTRTYGNRLCRGDIAQIVDTAARFQRGSCAFDSFTPYEKPK